MSMLESRRAVPDLLVTTGLLLAVAAPIGPLAPWLDALRDNGRNLADLRRQESSYYEAIVDVERRFDRPLEVDRPAGPRPRPFTAGPLAVAVDDLREHALAPNIRRVTRHGLWTTTTRGLRDRHYEWAKPPRTTRIAMLGDSIGVGWGVPDGAGFEPLLEDALNADSQARGGPAVEILNFAVPGHAPGQRLEQFLRSDGWACQPDALIYQATPADLGWDERALAKTLPRGLGWDAPQYALALRSAGLTRQDAADPDLLRPALRAAREALVDLVYRTIAAQCRRRGVQSAWILIPRVGRPADSSDRARLIRMARDAGFNRVIDLSRTFNGLSPADLAVAPDDYHPNALGHRRIAAALHASLAGWPPSKENRP